VAIKGLSFSEEHEYICKDDPCKTVEEGATAFYWSPLPNALLTRISDGQASASMSMGDVGTQTIVQKKQWRNRECFRFGVGRWVNFAAEIKQRDGSYKDVPILPVFAEHMEGMRTYRCLSDATLDQIPLSTINEIGEHIFNENSMTDVQRKNYEALLSRLGASSTSNAGSADATTNAAGDASAQQTDPNIQKGGTGATQPSSVTETPAGKTDAPGGPS
jgi:hypothetical protein